jgi:hypothetical protein
MPRLFAFAFGSVALGAALVATLAAGCEGSSVEALGPSHDDAAPGRRDGAPVDPSEAGTYLDSGAPLATSCEKYCGLVMANCTGPNAQYASLEDCHAFCAHLPLVQPAAEAEEKEAASVACRQYWADSPARTNPEGYCLAAGPFGANVCGDRCTAFCDALLLTCTPDGGVAVYESQPDCASACASFSFRDAGEDGGGEAPFGPKNGDTLNCRLYHLRQATKNTQSCLALHPDGGACERQ